MPKTSGAVLSAHVLEAALQGLGLQKERIEEQIRQVQNLLGQRRGRPLGRATEGAAPRKRRGIGAAGRRRIALAQKKRWAALKESATEKPAPTVKKRKMSAAGRAKIAAAARKRWAKVKKAAESKKRVPAAKKSALKVAAADSAS